MTMKPIYDPEHPFGDPKYLSQDERLRYAEAIPFGVKGLHRQLFCLTLLNYGPRISEALGITLGDVLISYETLRIASLKTRQPPGEPPRYRYYTLLPSWIELFERCFDLQGPPERLLWPVCRQTGWRWVKGVMEYVQLTGRRACPRGMRHAVGRHALHDQEENLVTVQKILGHANVKNTTIYTLDLDVLREATMKLAVEPNWVKYPNPLDQKSLK